MDPPRFTRSMGTIENKFTDVKLPTKDDIDELTQKLEHRGEDIIKETKRK